MVLKVKTGETVSDCQIMFPENGMHPNKLIAMGRELVWASQFFNIEIATFSPMLIEAIDVWSECFEIKVEFYLNKKEISSDFLFKLYDDLGKAYDEIDIIKLKNEGRKIFGCCCE